MSTECELIRGLETSVDNLRRDVSEMRELHKASHKIHAELKEISDVRCKMREMIAQASAMGLAQNLDLIRQDIRSLRTDIEPTRTVARLSKLEQNLVKLEANLEALSVQHNVTRANLESLYVAREDDRNREALIEEYSDWSKTKLIKAASALSRPDNDDTDRELRLEIISQLLDDSD